MITISVAGLALDAGDIAVATGIDASVRGDDITLYADLTQTQIDAAVAAIKAFVPEQNSKRINMLAAAKTVAQAVNGTAVTAMTTAQMRLLLGLFLADRGYIAYVNGQYVVSFPAGLT